nr:DNA topoisomerase IB [Thalassococcus arenae]
MSPLAQGHLWATGRDAKGRKQYRYNPDWQALRSERKYQALPEVGEALPTLRAWISRQLAGDIGARDTAVAAVLALIDRASMRPGNENYTKENKSFGATTLRGRHVSVDGSNVVLRYRAKGGQLVQKMLRGPALARVFERFADLPGPEIFVYDAGDGRHLSVRSEHLTEILARLCGEQVTPKALRTWAGSHAAFCTLRSNAPVTIKAMARAAAERLHNTPTVARNSYVHPKILSLAEAGRDGARAEPDGMDWSPDRGWRAGERALLRFLRG